MAIILNGVNPSLANPSLTFRGIDAKLGWRESKVFQASESARCLSFPSLVRPSSCHFIDLAVFDDMNSLLILYFKRKYLKTLAGIGSEATLEETFLLNL